MSSTTRVNRISAITFRELRLEEIVVRKHIHTACLFILAMVAGGGVLVHLKSVLIPFVLALGLFYSLVPIVDLLSTPAEKKPGRSPRQPVGRMSRRKDVFGLEPNDYKPMSDSDWAEVPQRKRVVITLALWWRWFSSFRLPRPVAVVVALIFASLVTGAISMILFTSINELVSHSSKYKERVSAMSTWIIRWGGFLGLDISHEGIAEELLMHTAFVSDLVMRSIRMATEELSNGFLMLLFTVYLLIGYHPDDRKVSGVRAEIDIQVKRYIGFKVLLSATTGVIVGVSLVVLKVDLALVFGLLAFLLNFIPNVGGVISTLLPMPVVVFDPTKSWMDILLTFLIPTTVHAIVGNFVEPRVLGGAMELHPIVVLLSLVLWGSLWGVVGMILSVPIMAVLKICLQSLNHPLPRFLASAFEGKIEVGESTASSPALLPAGSTWMQATGVDASSARSLDRDLEMSEMTMPRTASENGDRKSVV